MLLGNFLNSMLPKWLRHFTPGFTPLRSILPLFSVLSISRRYQFLGFIFLSLAASIGEFITIQLLIPFIRNLTAGAAESSFVLLSFKWSLSPFLIAILTCLSVLYTGAIRLFTSWLGLHLAAHIGTDISVRLMQKSLFLPYHLQHLLPPKRLLSLLTLHIRYSVDALNSILSFLSSLVIGFTLLFTLLFTSPIITSIVIFSVSITYFFVASSSKSILRRNAKLIEKYDEKQIQLVSESQALKKNILLSNGSSNYTDVFRHTTSEYRRLDALSKFLVISPKFFIESAALILFVIVAIAFSSNDLIPDLLPQLSVVLYGSQKLLPAIQQIYNGYSSFNYRKNSIESILEVCNYPDDPCVTYELVPQPLPQPIHLSINSLSFTHANASSMTVDSVSIDIHQGEKVAFVGATGSGKSTLMDLILTLYQPTYGSININGYDLFDPANLNYRQRWRSSISHVPQSSYLIDSSILNNITLESDKSFDLKRFEKACQISCVDSIIDSKPGGYDYLVGDNGRLLSGGQRQRVGLARAVYSDKPVLILDESTSALDARTEQQILSNFMDLLPDKTIILITHKPHLLPDFNKVYKLNDGKITLV